MRMMQAGGAEKLFQEFLWSCGTDGVYHPGTNFVGRETWVPHPSVLRVRVFFDAQPSTTALRPRRSALRHLQLLSSSPTSWNRTRTESLRRNTRRSAYPAQFQADRLCGDAGTRAPAGERA